MILQKGVSTVENESIIPLSSPIAQEMLKSQEITIIPITIDGRPIIEIIERYQSKRITPGVL